MSTYAVSDLHGYSLNKFKALLKKVRFTKNDTLYVLGDVIDRNGDGGVELLRYIMQKPNIEFILGNHEDMLLCCDFLFDEITDENIEELVLFRTEALERYLRNGGMVTLESLGRLNKENPDELKAIVAFLREAPLYEALTVKGMDFILVHAGLGGFSPEKKLKDYEPHELIWVRPALDEKYFDDIITVFGHTPTLYYGSGYEGKIIKTDTWINIDAGAAAGLAPALLRLDDLKVFYGEK